MRSRPLSVEVRIDHELAMPKGEDTYTRVRRVIDEALALLELPAERDDLERC